MADIAWDSMAHIRHANTNGGWVHAMPGEYTRDGSKEWDDDLTRCQIYPADGSTSSTNKTARKTPPSSSTVMSTIVTKFD
ncbi:hypothetical protein BGZ79_003945 [Entomortierella chlamydospora]|nr:hypothetical protein BGZ79_003945 [Entomortierella chlamydospora]